MQLVGIGSLVKGGKQRASGDAEPWETPRCSGRLGDWEVLAGIHLVLGTAMGVQRDLNGTPPVAQLGPAREQEAWHHPCWGPWGWPLTKSDGCCFSIASMSKLLTQNRSPRVQEEGSQSSMGTSW